MKQLRAPLWIAAASLAVSAAAAQPTLDAASIRAFVAAQNRAWNARDFRRFYATFDARAAIRIVKTARGGSTVRTTRTLAEDRKGAERFFASTQAIIRETDQIEKIAVAPNGRHARVRVREETGVVEHGRVKLLHAVTEQELTLRNGKIVSLGLTEFEGR